MKTKGLKNLKIGQDFIGFCIIRKREMRYKQNGEPYLSLELGDKSGRLKAKIWKNAEQHYQRYKSGQIIKIQGKIKTFQENKEVHIDKIRPILKEDGIKIEDLLPKCDRDIPSLMTKFQEHKNNINNQYLNLLFEKLFPDTVDLDSYLKSPTGKLWHHNYLYGVLEHTVCLLDLSQTLFEHYPMIDLDLLKSAIILQYLGNPIEFGTDGFIEYSVEGRLFGHVAISYDLANKTINEIPDFPADLRQKLLHLILSREGTQENGSPVLPMTLEGIIMNGLIQVDVKTNAALRIIRNDQLPDSEWTKFNNLFNRFLYVGKKPEHDQTSEDHNKMNMR
jgi:3'-5' exoribonuclease